MARMRLLEIFSSIFGGGPPVARALRRALAKHGLSYAVLLDANGQVVAEAGTPDRLTYKGMLSALLGPSGSPKKTVDWIRSEELVPQLYGQGGDFAILDRVAQGHVLVIAGTKAQAPKGMDAVAGYRWTKSVADDFQRALEPVLEAPASP